MDFINKYPLALINKHPNLESHKKFNGQHNVNYKAVSHVLFYSNLIKNAYGRWEKFYHHFHLIGDDK